MPEKTFAAKTTWTAGEGRMTFFLPDRSQHEVPATCIDKPNSVCALVDAVNELSELEQDVLFALVEKRRRR
jgi:hypothetical protein